MIRFLDRIPGRVYDIAVFVGIVALALLMAYMSPSAHAAPAAKQQEPGCTSFAVTGNIQLYHCVDEQGRVWLTNSMGFIAYGGN